FRRPDGARRAGRRQSRAAPLREVSAGIRDSARPATGCRERRGLEAHDRHPPVLQLALLSFQLAARAVGEAPFCPALAPASAVPTLSDLCVAAALITSKRGSSPSSGWRQAFGAGHRCGGPRRRSAPPPNEPPAFQASARRAP